MLYHMGPFIGCTNCNLLYIAITTGCPSKFYHSALDLVGTFSTNRLVAEVRLLEKTDKKKVDSANRNNASDHSLCDTRKIGQEEDD